MILLSRLKVGWAEPTCRREVGFQAYVRICLAATIDAAQSDYSIITLFHVVGALPVAQPQARHRAMWSNWLTPT